MEILTKKLRVLLVALIIATSLSAQQYAKIHEAFKKSYEYEVEGKYSNAIDEIKGVYDDKSYEINMRLGWLAYMNGLFTESQTYYQKTVNLKPQSIEAKLGYVLPAAALGNWDQVIAKYHEILDIDSKNYTATYRLGSIYYGREDYKKATKYFELLINLYPYDYYTMLMSAWTNYKLGKFREAKILFNKVLMFSPEDKSATEGLELIK